MTKASNKSLYGCDNWNCATVTYTPWVNVKTGEGEIQLMCPTCGIAGKILREGPVPSHHTRPISFGD